MKTILIWGSFMALAVTGYCDEGDEMLVTEWTKDEIAWTNCIAGTTCNIQVADSLTEGSWTDLVSRVDVTSARMALDLPELPADTAFLRVTRPFDPLLGLSAWYPFESNTLDTSVWHNDGTNNSVVFESGRAGLCGSFNGASTSVKVPQSPTLKLTNTISICAWIKPRATNGLRCIVDKDYNYVGYNLYVNDGRLHMRIGHSSLSAGVVTNGGWQHVAGVFNGKKIRIFVNGVQQGETASEKMMDRTDKDVYIGMWGPPNDGNSRYFYGGLDDVRIYARPLTPSEIRCIAQDDP